jgi:hypothetical protein
VTIGTVMNPYHSSLPAPPRVFRWPQHQEPILDLDTTLVKSGFPWPQQQQEPISVVDTTLVDEPEEESSEAVQALQKEMESETPDIKRLLLLQAQVELERQTQALAEATEDESVDFGQIRDLMQSIETAKTSLAMQTAEQLIQQGTKPSDIYFQTSSGFHNLATGAVIPHSPGIDLSEAPTYQRVHLITPSYHNQGMYQTSQRYPYIPPPTGR